MNNNRSYVIHLNLEHGCSNLDILESYYFSRVLDNNLLDNFNEETGLFNIEKAIRKTEWHFENEFDSDKLVNEIKENGWSLDYIYLESKKNRYEVSYE